MQAYGLSPSTAPYNFAYHQYEAAGLVGLLAGCAATSEAQAVVKRVSAAAGARLSTTAFEDSKLPSARRVLMRVQGLASVLAALGKCVVHNKCARQAPANVACIGLNASGVKA